MKKTDNTSIKIYVNKIENRIAFKIKRGYYLKLLMPETMNYLEALKIERYGRKWWKCTTFRNYWSSVLVKYNINNNDYQQDSRTLYTFVPNKSFGQLLDISHQNFIFLKTFNSEFHTLKYGLLIKTLNLWRWNKHYFSY